MFHSSVNNHLSPSHQVTVIPTENEGNMRGVSALFVEL